jgi:hypothetical protein
VVETKNPAEPVSETACTEEVLAKSAKLIKELEAILEDRRQLLLVHEALREQRRKFTEGK